MGEGKRKAIDFGGYVMDVVQTRGDEWNDAVYPFDLAAVRSWQTLHLHENVTFLVGENGSGKSTLIEAIAVAAGFNPEGGSRDHGFDTHASHSSLHKHLKLVRPPWRPKDGYFMRAETLYTQSTYVDNVASLSRYGGTALHEQSHGEATMAMFWHRFQGDGLYILDEPEAALSPERQLAFISRLHELVRAKSQFIIATHSPMILAYPNAWIYQMTSNGPVRAVWDELEHVKVSRQFLDDPNRFLKTLLED